MMEKTGSTHSKTSYANVSSYLNHEAYIT